jgi:hypothetical protein
MVMSGFRGTKVEEGIPVDREDRGVVHRFPLSLVFSDEMDLLDEE